MNTILSIKKEIIVSVQAAKNEPLYEKSAMQALIDTVVLLGHAKVLRLAGARDIKYTKQKYGEKVTVIGITKPDIIPKNYKELVYITPNVEAAEKIIAAGADIVAFDATTRNTRAKEISEYTHSKNRVAMGDIGSFEDAKYALDAGCDLISTTLSGYTKETEHMPNTPDFALLEKCVNELKVPVIMEGKIWQPDEAKKAFSLGAHAVVIGSAITRPHKIIERFNSYE